MASSGASQPPRKPTGTNPQDTGSDNSFNIFKYLQKLHDDLTYVRRQLLFVIQLMSDNFHLNQPLVWPELEVNDEFISIPDKEPNMDDIDWKRAIMNTLVFINKEIQKVNPGQSTLMEWPDNQRQAKLLEVAVAGLRHLVWFKNKGLNENSIENFGEYEKQGQKKILRLRDDQERTSKQEMLDKFTRQYKMFLEQVGRVAGSCLNWLLDRAVDLDLATVDQPANVDLIQVRQCLGQVYSELHPLADQVPMSAFYDVAREIFGRQEFEPKRNEQGEPIWFKRVEPHLLIRGYLTQLERRKWQRSKTSSESQVPASTGTRPIIDAPGVRAASGTQQRQGVSSTGGAILKTGGSGFQRVSRTGLGTRPSSTATTGVPFYFTPVEPPTDAMQRLSIGPGSGMQPPYNPYLSPFAQGQPPSNLPTYAQRQPVQAVQPRTQQVGLSLTREEKDKFKSQGEKIYKQIASGTQQGQGMSSSGAIPETGEPGAQKTQPKQAAAQSSQQPKVLTAEELISDDDDDIEIGNPPDKNLPETEPQLNREVFHFLRQMRPNLIYGRRQILVVMQLIFAGLTQFERPTTTTGGEALDINKLEGLNPNRWRAGFDSARLFIHHTILLERQPSRVVSSQAQTHPRTQRQLQPDEYLIHGQQEGQVDVCRLLPGQVNVNATDPFPGEVAIEEQPIVQTLTLEQRIAYYLEVAVEGLDYLIRMNAAGDQLFGDYLQHVRNRAGPTGHNRMLVEDLANRLNQLSARITNKNRLVGLRHRLFQIAEDLLRNRYQTDNEQLSPEEASHVLTVIEGVFSEIHRILSYIYLQLYPTPDQVQGAMEQFVDVARDIFGWNWRHEVTPDRNEQHHLFEPMRGDVYIRAGDGVLRRRLPAEVNQFLRTKNVIGNEAAIATIERKIQDKKIEEQERRQAQAVRGRGGTLARGVQAQGRGEGASGGAQRGGGEQVGARGKGKRRRSGRKR